MIKTYKSIQEYAKSIWKNRNTTALNYKNWLTELIKIEKGMNYIEVDKEKVIAEYISTLNRTLDLLENNDTV